MKLPRWKQEQRLRRQQKFVILARLAVLSSFFTLVFLAGFLVLKEVRSSSLPRDGRATIVLATEPVLAASFAPGGDLTVLSIPAMTYVEVSRGFGSYRIGAVFSLGEQEKLGGELLGETTQEFLGVPVDGWIGPGTGKWELGSGKGDFLNLKNKLISWSILTRPKELIKFWQSLKTNLTIFDLGRVWLTIKNTRFDKIQFLDLGQTPAVSSLILADGSTALSADLSLVDATIQGLFKEARLVEEHILIEVLNGTEREGLANRVSRLIANVGGSVVSLGNSQEKVSECHIRGEERVLKSFTAIRFGRIFKCQAFPGKLQESRADLQIIVGEDYWQRLFH